jgi:hypothetical protein
MEHGISRRELLMGSAVLGTGRSIADPERPNQLEQLLDQYKAKDNAVIGIVDGVSIWGNFSGFTINPTIKNPYNQDRYLVNVQRTIPHISEFGIGNEVVVVGTYQGVETSGSDEGMHVLRPVEIANLSTKRVYDVHEGYSTDKATLRSE